MSDWKECRLGDFIEFIIDNRGKNPPLSDSGYELIETNMISSNNKYPDFDKVTKYVSEDTYNNWFRKGHPKIGDILISTVGNIGKVAIVNEDKGCIAQNLIGLRVNEKIIAEYLYYFLIKKDTQDQLLALNIGSVQPSIKVPHLLNLEIKIPELLKQKECIQVLSKLDDKIQLNSQINQTLEQIAQALFKSWFVDFDPVRAKVQALSDGLSLEQAELAAMQAISGKTPEELTALSQTQPDRYAELAETAKAFPCEMVEVDGVEVPKGWELSTIGDCYDVVMGQSPKGETYNENKQGMIFYQGRAEFGWRFPTPRLFTTDPKRIAEQNSILMSVRAPVGDINIALEKCCIGRGLAALQHKSKSLSFGLYQIQSIKPELDLFNGEGTVFGSINQVNLKNIQIINPEEKFIQLFEKNLSSCDSKIMNNEIENNALKEIRDLLLPRLLSGEMKL